MSDETPQNQALEAEAALYFARLEKVDAYINRSLFAQVSKFRRPFSAQHKDDVRYRLPEDAQIYDEADRLQAKSGEAYLALRIITACLLFIYLGCLIALCQYLPDVVPFANGVPRLILLIGMAIITGAFLAVIRFVLRWYIIEHIVDKLVGKLAHFVASKFNEIKAETNHACSRIDSRTENGTGGWAQRAKGWSRIALWSTIRGDALDRYATTVFWKMHVSVTNTERLFRLLKGILLVVAIFILFWRTGSDKQQAWLFNPVCIGLTGLGWVVAWYFIFIRERSSAKPNRLAQFLYLFGAYMVFTLIWIWVGGLQHFDLTAPSIGAVFVSLFWFGWIVVDEKDDDLWTSNFIAELAVDKQAAPNTSFYFNILSERIQNLVEEIIDKDRSGRGTPPAGH